MCIMRVLDCLDIERRSRFQSQQRDATAKTLSENTVKWYRDVASALYLLALNPSGTCPGGRGTPDRLDRS
jgi:hypothetical protein